MTILIYDRSGQEGDKLSDILKKLVPDDNIQFFTEEDELLRYAGGHIFHVVFMRLEGSGEGELKLSGVLSRMIPGVNLILMADTEGFMAEAIRLHASGYICLPVTEEAAGRELSNLLYPVSHVLHVIRLDDKKPEVYIDEKPVSFAYSKTKELFILLLKMDGAMLRSEKMRDCLWDEHKPVEKSRSYLQNLRSDLIKTLALYGLEDAVCRRRGCMWLDRGKFVLEET